MSALSKGPTPVASTRGILQLASRGRCGNSLWQPSLRCLIAVYLHNRALNPHRGTGPNERMQRWRLVNVSVCSMMSTSKFR